MAYFTTLYSGSSGNCALIRSDDKYLLIDMGKSCRTTLTALKSLGLAVSDCVGILVTHEHSDHVSGLDTFLKKHPVPLYGCADTLDTLASRGTIPPAVEAIPVDGQTLEIGSFTVITFPLETLPHPHTGRPRHGVRHRPRLPDARRTGQPDGLRSRRAGGQL